MADQRADNDTTRRGAIDGSCPCPHCSLAGEPRGTQPPACPLRTLQVERDIAIALGDADDLDDALADLLARCLALDGVDAGGVYVLERPGGALVLRAHANLPADFVAQVSRFDAGSAEAALVGAGVSFGTGRRSAPPGPTELQREAGLRAAVAIPVAHRGEVVACLNVASRSRDALPEHTLHALESVAPQIAGAVVRLQAQRDLAASEARFRELVELLPEIVYETDSRGRLTFVNRVGYEATGYGDEDFARGVSALEIIAPEDRHRAAANIRLALGGTELGTTEYAALKKDGTRFPVMIRSVVIERDGRVAGLRGVIVDISERKRLEEQLHHASKMETVGELAGGIAHDFNNVLTGILGQATLLTYDADAGSGVHEGAARIQDAARRGMELSRQLLGFARRESRRVAPVDLHQIIRDVMALLAPTIESTIELAEDLDAPQAVIMGDAGALHQVLLNLAINARDAMPEGGTLTFASDADEVEPGETPTVRVVVRDTGVGIPEEHWDRIFEPFFTTKEAGHGTGMGLAVVHSIVQEHDGHLWLDSEVGEGTSIELRFPLIADPLPEAASEATAPKRGSGRILLVDDDPIVRQAGRAMLEHLGYQVLDASDGVEAVESYRRHGGKIDLVILDIVMPDMGGRECFEALKRLDPEVRVLLSTGYDKDGEVQESLERGVIGFVSKPYELAVLATEVRRALEA